MARARPLTSSPLLNGTVSIMWYDLQLAARLLAKDRAFTFAAVLSLVIGMSATIAQFTIVYGVYLRDLPFTDPDRIVSVGTHRLARGPGGIDKMSLPDLQDLQASATLFDGIAGAHEEPMDLADEDRAAERFVGAWVSADAFSLIGQRPARGRGFTSDDDRTGAAPVVLLGNDIWKRRYGSDPDILGAQVRVNGVPSTVIGIMPERFGFPLRSQLWQPLALRAGEGLDERGNRNIDAFGRLAAGATIAQGEADLARVMRRLAREFPETNATVGAAVRPFRDLTTGGPLRAVFTGLTGSAIFLLLIACANVGNLLLARGAARAREIVVRLSLGATRLQVIRQLLTESLLLAAIAGVMGFGLAALVVRVISARLPTGPYWMQFSIEGPVLAAVAAVCLGTTVLCGLVPALHASGVDLVVVLGGGGRTAGTRRTRRWNDGLVVAQLALSLTMLVAAGLLMRNVYAMSQVDPGVDTTGLVAAQITLPARTYPTDEHRRAFYRRLGEQLAAQGMPMGITSAAPGRPATRRNVLLDGAARTEESRSVSMVAIGPGYLEVLGIAPLRGRLFTPADDVASRAIVVNERFAAAHFPGKEAVGSTVRLETRQPGQPADGPFTIVGVVPNVRQAITRLPTTDGGPAEPVLYLTYAALPLSSATIVVRSNAGAAATALRQVLAALDPDLPLTGTAIPLNEAMTEELGIIATFGSMFALFALAALGLATVGQYGITAHGVAQRRRELGVRLALGAHARHIGWAVTRRAALQLAIGISLGLAGALGAGQLLQGVLMGVSARDPVTLIGIPVLMAVVTFVACLVPAARAVRLDPVAALRVE